MIKEIQKISELNKRIIIKKATKSKDSFGQNIHTYIDFLTTWAKVKQTTNLSNNEEKQKNSKMLNMYTLQFTIRYIHNLSDEMFIYYNKKYYRITNINNLDEKNLYLQITTELLED